MDQHDERHPLQPALLPDRRVVLRGALGATVLAGTLSACSGAADEAAPGAGDDAAGATPGTVVAAAADVPEGSGVIVGGLVVTQPTAGEFRAFGVTCTHAQCAVRDVEGAEIVCPCHGSRFSVQDGAALTGPASSPLEEVAVRLQGADVVRA
ncbi:Rieske (2Fe-2S) protein [Vallicoccus soli]|uniref:Cytochrome bc1 complex Rieske iron-sulfur subunit n=1 Tax=Vallicoccus soli TaxID=2339232 RepID=A0A3A3YXF3_9ACTN|nr:Rieske (2Fe-2S) protein [Vallicoccus soli]RJK93743.1 Rieske (2Fe-2S) protein [Vallicoccus soli]